eukprot:5340374-Amphidinium_carterae.1
MASQLLKQMQKAMCKYNATLPVVVDVVAIVFLPALAQSEIKTLGLGGGTIATSNEYSNTLMRTAELRSWSRGASESI